MITKDVLEETSPVANGSIFFWGFFLSISLSKYWFWTKTAEVIQTKTKATISTLEMGGIPNMKLPNPKMASHPTQLRNLNNRTKPLTLANIQSFHLGCV